MIEVASFDEQIEIAGRAVKALRFQIRREQFDDLDSIAASAAERLSHLFELTIGVAIEGPFESPIVEPDEKIVQMLHFAGSRRDALVVLQQRAAKQIAAWAFADDADDERQLSPLERRTCDRFLGEFARVVLPLTGDIAKVERATLSGTDTATTWIRFDCTLGRAACSLAVGFCSTASPSRAHVDGVALLDAVVDVRALLANTSVSARTILELRVGDVVRFPTSLSGFVRLCAGPATIALGECGYAEDDIAFLVARTIEEIAR